jgi:hypothetical protein
VVFAAHLSDERVRQLADEILAREHFARWRSIEHDWLRAILEWLARYLSWMDRLWDASPLLYWLIVCGLIALTLLLLAHVVWSIRVALAEPEAPPSTRRVPQAPRFAKQAEALAHEGRFVEAAHRLLLASIQLLVQRGAIELERHDANRTLRRRVAASSLPGEQRAEFLRLLDELERRWFRDRVADPDLYRAWEALHARLATLRAAAP